MVDGHTIDFGEKWEGWEGQWVKIKPWLSYASQRAIQAAMDGDDDRDPLLRLAIATVEQQVIEWHIIGADGEPLEQGVPGLLSDRAPIDIMDTMMNEVPSFYGRQRPAPFQATARKAAEAESPGSENSTPRNRAERRRKDRSRGSSSRKT